MIYIPVQGGLGNQLFILSMAHYLNAKYGKKVKLSFREDNYNKNHRDNFLHPFIENCSHSISVSDGRFLNLALRAIDKVNSISPSAALKFKKLIHLVDLSDPEEYRDSRIERALIIRGFFQSSELVEKIWDSMEPEFQKTLCSQFSGLVNENVHNLNLLYENYQCVHIRRGDYLENSNSIGVLSMDYFRPLLDEKFKIVITTDTLQSSELDFEIGPLILIDQNMLTPIQALSVMSFSKVLVMSNSTLSWWGSRLPIARGDKVYAPHPWFLDSRMSSKSYLFDSKFNYVDAQFIS